MTLPDSWETWMLVKKQQFESYMEQLTGSKLGKELWKVCILLPCLFNLYAEYIMWNARLDESQAEIKISRRNINNLIYADDTTLMAESDDELKNFLMRVKEESEKADWKLNIQKTKIMASGPITSWQIEGEKVEAVTNFIFLGCHFLLQGIFWSKNKTENVPSKSRWVSHYTYKLRINLLLLNRSRLNFHRPGIPWFPSNWLDTLCQKKKKKIKLEFWSIPVVKSRIKLE